MTGCERVLQQEIATTEAWTFQSLKDGKIQLSRSESAVSTLFVAKADGTKRWCMNMRPVNAITKADMNKSPLQESTRERLRGAKYFTRLDMRDGYHHLRIKEGYEHLTAFITEYGLQEWKVACFGLRSARRICTIHT
jgi:hypothetical protein